MKATHYTSMDVKIHMGFMAISAGFIYFYALECPFRMVPVEYSFYTSPSAPFQTNNTSVLRSWGRSPGTHHIQHGFEQPKPFFVTRTTYISAPFTFRSFRRTFGCLSDTSTEHRE